VNPPVIDLVPLTDARPDDVEALLDAAFGAERRQRTAYRLRQRLAPIGALSLAARDEAGRLAGTVQCWPLVLTEPCGGRTPIVLIGPVAVRPGLQRLGLGRQMMEATLAAAGARGDERLMLIGDPEYYGRFFGFSAERTGGWALPGPVERHRLLARAAPGIALPGTATLGPDPAFSRAAAGSEA
jgi:predicted N-acetyltransferase YhbS